MSKSFGSMLIAANDLLPGDWIWLNDKRERVSSVRRQRNDGPSSNRWWILFTVESGALTERVDEFSIFDSIRPSKSESEETPPDADPATGVPYGDPT